jgi:hypothetical protein
MMQSDRKRLASAMRHGASFTSYWGGMSPSISALGLAQERNGKSQQRSPAPTLL